MRLAQVLIIKICVNLFLTSVWHSPPVASILLPAWLRHSAATASWRSSTVQMGWNLPTCVRSVTRILVKIPPVKRNTSRWDIGATPVHL